MSLYTFLLFHVIANLLCWGRWSLSPIKMSPIMAVIYAAVGLAFGLIPMWPSSLVACWFLTILMVLVDGLWISWNVRAAEDSCVDKTMIFYEPEELKRYAPGSE